MTTRNDELRRAWSERSTRFGPSKRAVLFKRFPGWLNDRIHRQHVKFVAEQCPVSSGRVLDVGCGYGRLSLELAQRRPGLEFHGIDLCPEFARHFETTIGPCFNGPVQDYQSGLRFDYVMVVTTLMYLDAREQAAVLEKLKNLLEPGGVIACIEPASELFVWWRRLTGRQAASPTGGNVAHFLADELNALVQGATGLPLVARRSVQLVPGIAATAVHHAVAAGGN